MANAEDSNSGKSRSSKLPLFIAAAFVVSLCTSFLTQLPAYLGDLGIDTLTLSTIMSVASVVLTVSKVALGSFYDVLGKKLTVVFVLGLFAASFMT